MKLFNFIKKLFSKNKDKEIYLFCQRKSYKKNYHNIYRMYACRGDGFTKTKWATLHPVVKLKNENEPFSGGYQSNFYDNREKIIVWEPLDSFIRFKSYEDVEEVLLKDSCVRTMINSFDFFISENNVEKIIDMESLGYKRSDMKQHTFKSNPILKTDSRYENLKDQLYNKDRCVKVVLLEEKKTT